MLATVILVFFNDSIAVVGLGFLIFQILISQTPHSVGLLWTSNRPVARDLYLTTPNTQETHIHAPGGTRASQTHDLDRAATEIDFLCFYSCKCSYGYSCYIDYQSYQSWWVVKITRKCQKCFALRSFSVLSHSIFHVFLHKSSFFKFGLPINYDASFGKHKFSQPFTKTQQKYQSSNLKANYLNLYNSLLLHSCQKTEGFFNSLLPICDTVFYPQYFSARKHCYLTVLNFPPIQLFEACECGRTSNSLCLLWSGASLLHKTCLTTLRTQKSRTQV